MINFSEGFDILNDYFQDDFAPLRWSGHDTPEYSSSPLSICCS
ncbi:hypothetical protein CCP3SC5AM1_430011 [Gammaproteobacteria bacterium]